MNQSHCLGSKEFILNCLYFVLLDLHLTVMSVEDLVTPYALPLFVILNVGASYSAYIYCLFMYKSRSMNRR